MRDRYVDIERIKDKFISLDWSVNKWVNDVDISLALSHEDLKPVKHGHWEFIGGYGYQYRCSECVTCAERKTAYCPHCGARMDEVKE